MTREALQSVSLISCNRGEDVSRVLNVVLAADANYAMPLTVAMCSLALNCDRARRLRFYVVHVDIVGELRARVERSIAATDFPDVKISWIDLPMESVDDLKIGLSYTTPLTFARLLIDDLIPLDVGKALYLDSDVVVLEDVSELFDTDVAGKAIWAVRDMIASVSRPAGITNYSELGIPADAHYFNAGVLLINVEKWREKRIGAELLKYLRTHHESVQMADQEALNAVLWDDWGMLEWRWNSQIPWRGVRRGWTSLDWAPDASRRSIVHYTSAEKPWRPGCDYRERRLFFCYLDRTEWKGWRVPLRRELIFRVPRFVSDIRGALGRIKGKVRSSLSLTRAA